MSKIDHNIPSSIDESFELLQREYPFIENDNFRSDIINILLIMKKEIDELKNVKNELPVSKNS